MAQSKKMRKARTFIKNYGLMWRRDSVYWGRANSKGVLQGRKSHKIIDFRDQIGIYVLYDETRLPIYVGQAGQGNLRLFNRLRNHTKDFLARRWQYFSWFGLLVVNKNGTLSKRDAPTKRVSGTIRSTLDEIEGVLIAATEPAFNKQGAKFKGITRYKQVPHADADQFTPVQLRDLLSKINRGIDHLKSAKER